MTLYFNDIDHDNMEELSAEIRRRQKRGRYDVCFQSKAFADAFAEELPIMQKQESANLVILDQCGIKEINGGIFSQLVHSPTTDILFFISTTAIRRFISEDVIQRHFPIPADEIRNVPLYQIHRFICSYYYEKLIPPGKKYYLAPFSIRKGNQPNIYGIIFGSGSLLGLEKFLDVCWSIDPVTGEANYNIDQDTIREGQLSIFEEENVIRKQDQFEKDTEALLASQITDNRPLYRFCLENGFRPTHLVTILRNLQRSGKLQVTDPKTGELLRKGTFHISWEKYAVGHPSALFEYLGESK